MQIPELLKSKRFLTMFPATIAVLIVMGFILFSMSPSMDKVIIGGASATFSDNGNADDCHVRALNFYGYTYNYSDESELLVTYQGWYANSTEIWNQVTTVYVKGNITRITGTLYIDNDAFLTVGKTANQANLNQYFKLEIRCKMGISTYTTLLNSTLYSTLFTYSGTYLHTFNFNLPTAYSFAQETTYVLDFKLAMWYDDGSGGGGGVD